MIKRLLSLFTVCLLVSSVALAQSGTITGTVTDQETGDPLPAVNVYVVETQQGAAANTEGEYSIDDVEYGEYTLRATFVGYDRLEQTIVVDESNETINVQLNPQTQYLKDVVVTAFGLDREERSLSYSIQEVSGENLTVGDGNIVSALSGQAAGIQVVGSPGSALGGSSKIRIRGAGGLSPGNPLFVVNGTPVSNTSFAEDARDYGNLAQDINLDDVESVSVLKGAAAAAMYGNRASDGVILIETKGGTVGERPFQVTFQNSTSLEEIYVLPNYQNEYAGGYTQELIDYTDPASGETVQGLNYAADESWGPKIDGQMYRPWWSWFHGDFDGDGQDDYGKEVPLTASPDNVRNFYENGVEVSNSLAISGGSANSSYRVSVENSNNDGVMPNSSLDKTFLNFSGALDHNNKITSEVNFNYVNTQGKGRPAQTYSPSQGNPVQAFNQWFQRQLDMEKMENYRLEDGTLTSWNIQSPSNTTPLYWNSPYFSVYENVPEDNRDRMYGSYGLTYQLTPNMEIAAKTHADFYNLTIEDRIASGGLNTDWYRVADFSQREMNYEGSLRYQQNFNDISVDGFLGANLRNLTYNEVTEETVGGLSVPDLFNISASNDRPDVSNLTETKEVRSVYGTATFGWQDMVYLDLTLRNDWSSALPENNNSYLYGGVSGSLVFTELSAFDNIDFLTFGKLRASYAQVGDDLDPYQIYKTYSVQNVRGSNPALTVPNTLTNTELKPQLRTDTEFGIDLRFLDGRLRLDGTYYESISEDEILQLQVTGASGYNEALVNAGKFTKTGLEIALGGTPFQTQDWSLDLNVNWSTIFENTVNELHPQLNSRMVERPSFFIAGSTIGLYAREGEEWGKIVSQGYLRHEETGEPIINPGTGSYATDPEVEHGTITPDWNGGVRANLSYKNFALSAFVEYQQGGQFYSVTKMWNNYSGLSEETVGDNALGNPVRNPIIHVDGSTTYINDEGDEVPYTTLPYDQAAPESGGVLVEGVDQNGNSLQHITDPSTHYNAEFVNNEAYVYDASYIKLRNLKVTYNLPTSFMETLPISRASISVSASNPWLIYSSVDGVDPSMIQEPDEDSFGWWEGGTVPGTRSIGASINLTF